MPTRLQRKQKGGRKMFTRSKTSKFTLFPRLPVEIRLRIWEHACSNEPRIVEICQIDDHSDYYTPNANPFYSPSLPPALLSANRESRSVAERECPLSFPNSTNPARIRFNASVDTLFFPAWAFKYSIRSFEKAVPNQIKDTIQRVAIETLVWYADWNDGYINNQMKVKKFRNLKELMLVDRKVDFTGCGCCHEFDGPEKGRVGLRETEFDEARSKRCREEFKRIREKDEGWNEPVVSFADLLRDGVLI